MKTHDLECLWPGLDNILTLIAIRGQKMELEMKTKKDGKNMEIILIGEINTNTAPELKTLFENDPLYYKLK